MRSAHIFYNKQQSKDQYVHCNATSTRSTCYCLQAFTFLTKLKGKGAPGWKPWKNVTGRDGSCAGLGAQNCVAWAIPHTNILSPSLHPLLHSQTRSICRTVSSTASICCSRNCVHSSGSQALWGALSTHIASLCSLIMPRRPTPTVSCLIFGLLLLWAVSTPARALRLGLRVRTYSSPDASSCVTHTYM